MCRIARQHVISANLFNTIRTLLVTSMAAGVEIKMVSQRLGHSQISTTADLYTHVSKGFSRAAAEQIAGIPKPSSGAVPTAFLQQTHRNQSSEGG